MIWEDELDEDMGSSGTDGSVETSWRYVRFDKLVIILGLTPPEQQLAAQE